MVIEFSQTNNFLTKRPQKIQIGETENKTKRQEEKEQKRPYNSHRETTSCIVILQLFDNNSLKGYKGDVSTSSV